MGEERLAPGTSVLHLTDGVSLLRPEEQVFDAMLEGWRAQQVARNLALGTITRRLNASRTTARNRKPARAGTYV